MWLRRLACLACVLLVVACSDDGSSSGPTDADEQPAVVDPEVVTIHAVIDEPAPPCDDVAVSADQLVVTDPSGGTTGSCLLLGPAAVDASSIVHVEMVRMVDDLVDVAVDLDDEGARALDELAASLYPVEGRAAILLSGRFLTAPTVVVPEFDGLLLAAVPVDQAVELVTALGGDPTVPELGDVDRASALCGEFRPDSILTLPEPTTAGDVTTALGDDAIEPWASLPADHFVARCTYPATPEATETTICPDGTVGTAGPPDQWLVDEEGRSTPDPTATRGPVAPCA
jgi:hypothetical protein